MGLRFDGEIGFNTNNVLGGANIRKITPKEKEQYLKFIKEHQSDYKKDIEGRYERLTDKNGNPKMGRVVKYQQQSFDEILRGDILKPLAKVKKSQVRKFLDQIKALGLDISESDIISKTGTLNPNFKVDKDGNISFKDINSYIKGKGKHYFETDKGEWAESDSPISGLTLNIPAKIEKSSHKHDGVKNLPFYPSKDKAEVKQLPYNPILDKHEVSLFSLKDKTLIA